MGLLIGLLLGVGLLLSLYRDKVKNIVLRAILAINEYIVSCKRDNKQCSITAIERVQIK